MSDTKIAKVACVGAGYFSQFHYESWQRMPNAVAVASCNRDIDKAKATGLPAFSDLEEMLKAHNPSILDVILPPVAHATTIRTALSHGVKWIICQKPFCQSLAEAKDIVAEAEAAGATIIIHENFRFQPWFRKIKSLLEAGAIGRVHQATFRLRPGDGQGPRAYLDRQPYFQEMPRLLIHETGVHYIDTFRYLLGSPSAVYADLRKMNPVIAGEDAGYVIFDLEGGTRAVFDGNRHLDHAADNTRRTMGEALIEGEVGTLKLYGDGSVTLRKFETLEEKQVLGPDTWQGFGGDCVHALQSHVISGFLNEGVIENAASDYLNVIEIEEAIYESARDARKISLKKH